MKNAELIANLTKMPLDAEVVFSDGFNCIFYSGQWVIEMVDDIISIGGGGTEIKD